MTHDSPSTGPPQVTDETRVRPHTLSARLERRSWIVGRVETGVFIAIPQAGRRALDLLTAGHTVAEVRQRLRDETSDDINVAGFVTSLVGLGFVAAIDGRRVPGPEPPRPSLPWLKPRHVRWLLHTATWVSVAVPAIAAAIAIAANPALLPRYEDLLWSRNGSAVLLANAAIAWCIIGCHELAHLSTARAAGVPGRISLSTRLQFLAAQTDVSGVWGHPRRVRMTVYLAGMTVNVVIAAAGILVLAILDPAGPTDRLVAATVLLSLLFLPTQLLIFMRTDVYFVIQDLTGCANLYRDGSAYLLYLAKRARPGRRRDRQRVVDPTARLGSTERRAIRIYSLILVGGTAVCLAVAATVTLPVAFTLLIRAVTDVTGSASTARRLDGACVLLVIGGFQLLWARTWWRRHGNRVRHLLRATRHRASEGR